MVTVKWAIINITRKPDVLTSLFRRTVRYTYQHWTKTFTNQSIYFSFAKAILKYVVRFKYKFKTIYTH